MNILLALILIIITFSSIIITSIAIIQILSNDFKDSKGKWILISMIAFIGPILWITKGRKLITKRTSEDFINTKKKYSIKSHYFNLVKDSNPFFKFLFLTSIFLIFFGYIVRLFDIYFFWESTAVGFGLLLLTVAQFLIDDINSRTEKGLNKIFSYILTIIIGFIILIQGIIAITLPNTRAYRTAKVLLKDDSALTTEIGKIHSFSVLPKGSFSTHSNQYGSTGKANMTLIIKGEKKYIEKNVILEKELEEEWTIISID